ncbi:LysR substrate-binding domain-containing protein [Ostreiculturibacter nitratireducens]|uniref:LysR substrate-binding domain-containing protein n=1 Tax=Ostreiculturibacter nitratireducens TaxID=3075226 RepID=UPI0031B64966
MPRRPYDLPPMSALIAFEAAARLVSFKSAAQELNVTPAAISHQVKALEAELQQTLFRRHHRGVELTETGAYLLVAMQRGLEEISDAIAQLRSRSTKADVTIHTSTAVSSLWLAPKLARFWKSFSHISVTQNVSDVDVHTAYCDLSIHYGDIAKATGDCRVLFRDRIMALGSPRFRQEHPVSVISDFASLPLIHLEAGEAGWTEWRDWCRALGYDGPLRKGFRVNNYVIALQAAQDDIGAVLGWDGLTGPLVASGKLVRLIPDCIVSPLDFYIKVHPHASSNAIVFTDWLLREAREE